MGAVRNGRLDGHAGQRRRRPQHAFRQSLRRGHRRQRLARLELCDQHLRRARQPPAGHVSRDGQRSQPLRHRAADLPDDACRPGPAPDSGRDRDHCADLGRRKRHTWRISSPRRDGGHRRRRRCDKCQRPSQRRVDQLYRPASCRRGPDPARRRPRRYGGTDDHLCRADADALAYVADRRRHRRGRLCAGHVQHRWRHRPLYLRRHLRQPAAGHDARRRRHACRRPDFGGQFQLFRHIDRFHRHDRALFRRALLHPQRRPPGGVPCAHPASRWRRRPRLQRRPLPVGRRRPLQFFSPGYAAPRRHAQCRHRRDQRHAERQGQLQFRRDGHRQHGRLRTCLGLAGLHARHQRPAGHPVGQPLCADAIRPDQFHQPSTSGFPRR